jgi:two-component system sensor histidine kinase KdpD
VSKRGRLRVYLGAAPGVGKTYRMLDEGRRRRERGTDVVVGFVETHGRPRTAAMAQGFETIPRLVRDYRGATFEEMDLDALLARAPEVALVDELPHTNVPGSRHEKRWQDVETLLEAGIDVVTTVNVQHLESLNDVVRKITKVPQRETVPDEVVRAADQIELVDMTPEALRRRLAHGNIYAAEQVDASLSNYFRVGNLTALRELALLWLADRVDEGLKRYREAHNIEGVWETRERVVVALTGGPEGETLIRRAARIAARASAHEDGNATATSPLGSLSGSELLAVHVARSDGLVDASPRVLAEQRQLVESLGGTLHSVVGDNVAEALLDFARAQNATQLVIGVSRRSRIERLLGRGGVGDAVVRGSGDIDVHMVTHERAAGRRLLPRVSHRDSVRRGVLAPLAAVGLPAVCTAVLANLRGHLNLTSQVLVFLVAVVGAALLGGLLSALVAAVCASLLLNYYFIPPVHRFTIYGFDNVLALLVFVVIALTVASVVDRSARQARRAARASAEAETLATFAMSVLSGDEAIDAMLRRFQETFGMRSVSLLTRDPDHPAPDAAEDPDCWSLLSSTGAAPCLTPAEADVVVPAGEGAVLALTGRRLSASDQRVLTAFAAQAAAALERRRLAVEAATAKPLAAADRMRTALLAAVSHDLRTPLSAAKAAVTSLRNDEIDWSPQDRDELLATAEESLDRLARLVENLLDMSRLQAGALNLRLEAVDYEDVLPHALDGVDEVPGRFLIEDLSSAPPVRADPALLERVVANLLANAARYAPDGTPVVVNASALEGVVELRVVDRGPGIAAADRDLVFRPFQRLGDRDNGSGVGLGLALSRGLVEAMGGTLVPEDTPGGGLTMVVSLPAAPRHDAREAEFVGPPARTEPRVADHG